MTEFTAERPEYLYIVEENTLERVRVIEWQGDNKATLNVKHGGRWHPAHYSDLSLWGYRRTEDEAVAAALDDMKTALLEAVQELQDMQDNVDAMVLAMPRDLEAFKASLKRG